MVSWVALCVAQRKLDLLGVLQVHQKILLNHNLWDEIHILTKFYIRKDYNWILQDQHIRNYSRQEGFEAFLEVFVVSLKAPPREWWLLFFSCLSKALWGRRKRMISIIQYHNDKERRVIAAPHFGPLYPAIIHSSLNKCWLSSKWLLWLCKPDPLMNQSRWTLLSSKETKLFPGGLIYALEVVAFQLEP